MKRVFSQHVVARVTQVAWHPVEPLLLIATCEPAQVIGFDLSSRSPAQRFTINRDCSPSDIAEEMIGTCTTEVTCHPTFPEFVVSSTGSVIDRYTLDGRWLSTLPHPKGSWFTSFCRQGALSVVSVARTRSRLDRLPTVWLARTCSSRQVCRIKYGTQPVAIHPDGELFAYSCIEQGGSVVRFLRLTADRVYQSRKVLTVDCDVLDLAFTPDGRSFVVVDGMPGESYIDAPLTVYSLPGLTRQSRYELHSPAALDNHDYIVESHPHLAVTPDSQSLYLLDKMGDLVTVPLRHHRPRLGHRHRSPVRHRPARQRRRTKHAQGLVGAKQQISSVHREPG